MERRRPIQVLTFSLSILVGCVGVAVFGWLLIRWYAYQRVMRHEALYNSEQERLYTDFEKRLRIEIDAFEHPSEGGRTGKERTDHLFDMLHLSSIANNSREVSGWRNEPESPDRQAIALKWARAAADEAHYHGELHRRWRLDYERGIPPHHITADEVEPFAMPEK